MASAIFLMLFAIGAAAPLASAGYGDYGNGDSFSSHHHQLDGYPIKTIDLGTFVGKHHLPPNTIKITKTVQVKIPKPYRVDVPKPIPYPVPVPKPYPVEVPKYIKIKEQVPVYIPTHGYNHGSSGSEHYGGSSGNEHQHINQEAQHFNFGGAGSSGSGGLDHFGGSNGNDHSHQEAQHYGGGSTGFEHNQQQPQQYAGDSGAYNNYQQYSGDNGGAGYQQVQHQHGAEYQQQQYQPQYDAAHAGAEHQTQYYAQQELSYPNAYDAVQQQSSAESHQPQSDSYQPSSSVQHSHHQSAENTGDYSGKQLIYTNPRQGIAAYKVFDSHGNKGFEYQQDQVNESPDGSMKSHISKSEQTIASSGANTSDGDKGDYYSNNYTEQVHEVREVHEEGSETTEEQRPIAHHQQHYVASDMVMMHPSQSSQFVFMH